MAFFNRRLESSMVITACMIFLSACSPRGGSSGSADLASGIASVPTGFTDQIIATNLNQPTVMQFAPDGRLFVALQYGEIRIIKDEKMLSTPFASIPGVHGFGERGFMGIAFDPDFASNSFIYIYYTAEQPFLHNRVSRITANGDVMQPGSEVILFEMENMSGASNPWHAGGALNFGSDGKLYIMTGDNTESAKAQSLTSLFGKVLRINRDGSIPNDNPFDSQTTGIYKSIWAIGLRNPFTASIQPGTGRLLINDVGQDTWEEINLGLAGANYGWPLSEGPTSDQRFTSPFFAYRHNEGCSITGSAFYNPTEKSFPQAYWDKYLFSDYCAGYIKALDPQNGTVATFATGLSGITDLKVSPTTGALYYLSRGQNSLIGKLAFGGSTLPVIGSQPVSVTVSIGGSASFSCSASGPAPLTYQWQRNQVNISGATSSTLNLTNLQLSDSGAKFRCVATNPAGSRASEEATLTVTSNRPPIAQILTPMNNSTFMNGQTLSFSGQGTDPEEGNLPASAYSWKIDLYHGSTSDQSLHAHPTLPKTSGMTSGQVSLGDLSSHQTRDIYYMVQLTVTDSAGLSHTVEHRLNPAPVNVPGTLEAEHAALLNGATPTTGFWIMGDANSIADQFNFPETTTYQFQVKAAGTFAAGDWPRIGLLIDGTQVASVLVNSATTGIFTMTANVTAGVHTVKLIMTNDFWDGTNDRNLFVDQISIAKKASDDGPSFVQCAVEGQRCVFTGTKEVRYGAGTVWVTKTFTDGVNCTNDVFGDPLKGTVKKCEIVGSAQPETWTTCAIENQRCSFTGTKTIRYGAGITWVTKVVNGGVDCSNAIFGDPVVGVTKSCQISSVSPTPQQWVYCSKEYQFCSFTGTKNVRYGSGSNFVIKTFTGGVDCSNSVFGDPAFGITKTCEISDP